MFMALLIARSHLPQVENHCCRTTLAAALGRKGQRRQGNEDALDGTGGVVSLPLQFLFLSGTGRLGQFD